MRQIAFATVKYICGMTSLSATLIVASIDTMTPVIKFVGLVAGAMLTMATFISVGFDIRRKWRNRNRDKDDS